MMLCRYFAVWHPITDYITTFRVFFYESQLTQATHVFTPLQVGLQGFSTSRLKLDLLYNFCQQSTRRSRVVGAELCAHQILYLRIQATGPRPANRDRFCERRLDVLH